MCITDFTTSYKLSSVVHQSQDPSAPFPLAFRTSKIVVLSKLCSTIGATEVYSWRENIGVLVAGGATRTWRRIAFSRTLPFDKISLIPPCIYHKFDLATAGFAIDNPTCDSSLVGVEFHPLAPLLAGPLHHREVLRHHHRLTLTDLAVQHRPTPVVHNLHPGRTARDVQEAVCFHEPVQRHSRVLPKKKETQASEEVKADTKKRMPYDDRLL
ncbi:L-aspartate oxidase [Striga asiatica]|uniref:L-aspartate oxidase n=1 Tax=Striga asiatica TaxID=4170 RepID=A0A5A7RBI5_STRAF|nr:L-aspartate oxidase [Striga asiatica]